jgi:hypothetical protein
MVCMYTYVRVKQYVRSEIRRTIIILRRKTECQYRLLNEL